MIGYAILSDTARERLAATAAIGQMAKPTGVFYSLLDQHVIKSSPSGDDNFLQGDSQWLTVSKPASAPVRQKTVVS
ncbi:hypothetical protein HCU01_33220 [Halomonas cupida]|uniref:Uncharacterized protein n=1 Tax=Halomonas cupida TaxID=44933 RepID=A0A1M7KI59_9GAMM|nr:hypothetical protein HCU01_33220 [Halomonas cupida]SHM65088.1 hypothetical protein SAMN05660971_03533 [Halomonas cupida]